MNLSIDRDTDVLVIIDIQTIPETTVLLDASRAIEGMAPCPKPPPA
jgi:hypothetical protein